MLFLRLSKTLSSILEGVFGDDSWEEIVYIIDRIRRLVSFHSSVKFMLHVHMALLLIIQFHQIVWIHRYWWVPKRWPTAFLVSFIKYNISCLTHKIIIVFILIYLHVSYGCRVVYELGLGGGKQKRNSIFFHRWRKCFAREWVCLFWCRCTSLVVCSVCWLLNRTQAVNCKSQVTLIVIICVFHNGYKILSLKRYNFCFTRKISNRYTTNIRIVPNKIFLIFL